MPVSSPARTVLRGFIEASNAQYRDAGLGQYQMRLERDGTVTIPHRSAPAFKVPAGVGGSAAGQAAAGAAQTAAGPTAGAAPADPTPRSGAAPTVTSVAPTATGFALRWAAVPGAAKYGIYVDGALVGHVPKPSFDGTVAAGSGGVIQVDAVTKTGARTALSSPMAISRAADGKLQVADPNAAQGAAATAPAAAAQ
jgi:hypothetical protein